MDSLSVPVAMGHSMVEFVRISGIGLLLKCLKTSLFRTVVMGTELVVLFLLEKSPFSPFEGLCALFVIAPLEECLG